MSLEYSSSSMLAPERYSELGEVVCAHQKKNLGGGTKPILQVTIPVNTDSEHPAHPIFYKLNRFRTILIEEPAASDLGPC
jgi:hypothetical protein